MADQLDTQEEDRPTTESITAGLPAPSSLPPPIDGDGYRTSPDQATTAWPPGIPYIVGNEACERFSFYGMKALLQPHLTALFIAAGYATEQAQSQASSSQHFFIASVYALPMIGAIVADRLLGKYRTIFYLSLLYCLGHGVLAVAENTLTGMFVGLGLIALGSGGIKPCVSANVGDQFGRGNMFRLQTVYQIFYFSVNFGSFFSSILSPLTMKWWGPAWAFGIPGALMLVATVVFWLGRKQYVHVPPRPGGVIGLLDTLSSTFLFLTIGSLFFTGDWQWWLKLSISLGCLLIGLGLFVVRQRWQADDGFLAITLYALGQRFKGKTPAASPDGDGDDPAGLRRSWFWAPAVERFGLPATEGPVAVLRIMSVFFLISVFWALFDQHATTWIVQAEQMDLRWWGGEGRIMANQIQSVNPLLVMIMIPLLNPAFALLNRRGLTLTPLRRMTIGMFIAALAFVTVAGIQVQVDAAPGGVWFAWQMIPYLLMTLAEVLVSITALEFAYTQAPRRMKSTVMGFWLLTVSLGNMLTGLLTGFSDLPLGTLFWVFSGLCAIAAVLFGVRSYFYAAREFKE